MISVLFAIAAFVAMEPVTAAAHRFVMHGAGERLHRSHHRVRRTRFEANDLYPVMFAAAVIIAMWFGFNRPGLEWLAAIAVGITAYGAMYALVHDVYIHRRLGALGDRRIPGLGRLATAHRVHHRTGGAPYGMLWPVVPSGSRPAHEPRDP